MSNYHSDVIDTPCPKYPYDIYDDEPRTTSSVVRYPVSKTRTRQAKQATGQQTAVRVRHHVPVRAGQQSPARNRSQRRTRSKNYQRQASWAFLAGMALVVMLTGWVVISMVTTWWGNLLVDWQYGTPRTYQTDVQVGHGDDATASHFIAQNLNGRIVVIQIAGGDPAHTTIYAVSSLAGEDAEKIPVTLEFTDVNGDSLLDMIIVANDSRIIYLNEKETFRPVTKDDTISME